MPVWSFVSDPLLKLQVLFDTSRRTRQVLLLLVAWLFLHRLLRLVLQLGG
jgi:hypothetical protein